MSRVIGEDIKIKLQCHNRLHTLTNPLYSMAVSAEHRSTPAETSKGNSDFSKRVACEVMKKNSIPVNI